MGGRLALFAFVAWAPSIGLADAVGTATFRVEGIAASGQFCVQVAWNDLPVTVFGTPINLGTSVAALLCTGNVTAGVATGHCESTPDNTQLSYDFNITSQANKGLGFAFVGDMTNISGAVSTAIGAATYIFDGAADTGYQPLAATTIPGCSLAADSYFIGVTGINVFRNEAVAAGGSANISASPSYTNPETGAVETLMIDVGFAGVTTGGNVLVTATSSVAGEVPSNFSLELAGYRPSFFDISTDAEIAPPITICQHYADADDDGVVDGTSLGEELLTLLHGEGVPLVFEDRTVSRDPVNNVICAQVNSLSPFVVAAEVPSSHDSAVLPVAAAKLTIGESGATVTKNLKIKVQNADLAEIDGHEIRLAVTSSTCPASLLLDAASQPVLPDFDSKSTSIGNSILVVGGKTKVATLPLRVVAADYTSPNAKSPARCALTLTATSLAIGPVAEVNPSNNQITVAIDVIDKTDF